MALADDISADLVHRSRSLDRLCGEALHHRHPGAAFLVATVVGEESPLARAMRRLPNGSIAPLTGTTLGVADASARERDTTTELANRPAPAGRLRLQDLFDAVLYAGPVARELGPSGRTYREDPEYVREIRRRITILSAFDRVDIWSEDLDRMLQDAR